MKIKNLKKKNLFFFGGGGGQVRGGVGLGGQGRCEQRSEVFVKKKCGGGVQVRGWGGGGRGLGRGGGGLVGGGQGGCERRIEVFVKIQKKNLGGVGVGFGGG